MKKSITLVLGWAVLGLLTLGSASADLVHHWAFNNNLTDSSGSGNDGSLIPDLLGDPLGDGTADYVADGKFGSAYNLNSGEGIRKLAANNLPLNASDPWSMNVWLRLASAPPNLGYLAGFGDHNTITTGSVANSFVEHGQARSYLQFGAGYYFWGFNGSGAANLPNPDVDSGQAYIANNTWNMYTIVNDGTTISMYTNGTFVTSGANNLVTTPFNQVQVGNPSIWTAAVRANIDEFAIWNRALSQADIGNLFVNNAAIPEPTSFAVLALGAIGLISRRRRV